MGVHIFKPGTKLPAAAPKTASAKPKVKRMVETSKRSQERRMVAVPGASVTMSRLHHDYVAGKAAEWGVPMSKVINLIVKDYMERHAAPVPPDLLD